MNNLTTNLFKGDSLSASVVTMATFNHSNSFWVDECSNGSRIERRITEFAVAGGH